MEKWQVNRDRWSVTMDLGPNSEWVAEMQWPEGETQGGPAVLVIYPSDPSTRPPGGLSQTVLRDVDFGYARDRLRASLSNSKRWENARKRTEDALSSLLNEHAGGSITPDYLALLSSVYVGAVKSGQDKPLEHLAKITGNSAAAIKNHLWQATRKGLLERSPGRAGGHLTDKGRQVLDALVSPDEKGNSYRRDAAACDRRQTEAAAHPESDHAAKPDWTPNGGEMTAKAWLEGDEFDLQNLARELTDGAIRIIHDTAENAYYLTADDIDAAPNVAEANAVALRLIRRISALGRVRDANFAPLKLRRFTDDEGRNQVVGVMAASMGTLRVRIEGTVTRADGTVDPPPPSPLPDYLALANDQPDVVEVLDILIRTESPGWVELYKVHEIIRDSIKPKKFHDLGWAEKATDSAFTGSANLPGVSGPDARHARMGGTPKQTMTLSQGNAYVSDLVTKWLNYLQNP